MTRARSRRTARRKIKRLIRKTFYPEVSEVAEDKSTTTLKDGTTVKWTINANENNNYQNKLDKRC